ncbi:MAG: cold-shock protein [Endozoicomonadaceae bacterium]|nr:cold-shock protein [Endozoicomonadaceae bacterium]MBE8233328.1 cold-shock protein [Endozoicomonadaceae bacterium]
MKLIHLTSGFILLSGYLFLPYFITSSHIEIDEYIKQPLLFLLLCSSGHLLLGFRSSTDSIVKKILTWFISMYMISASILSTIVLLYPSLDLMWTYFALIGPILAVLFNLFSHLSRPYTITTTIESREKGTVKWFNNTKGFGFITRDEGSDIFVHYRSIRGVGHRFLLEGQRVEFSIASKDKGLQAEDVIASNE